MPIKTCSASPMRTPPKKKRSQKTKSGLLIASLDESMVYVHSLPNRARSTENALVFTLPLCPLSLNSEVHWRIKHEVKTRYHSHFWLLKQSWLLPLTPREPWQKVTITAAFFTKSANDMDNLISRAKVSIDAVVRGRWIQDDSPAHLTWGAIPTQTVDDKSPPYLVLTFTRDLDALIGEEGC